MIVMDKAAAPMVTPVIPAVAAATPVALAFIHEEGTATMAFNAPAEPVAAANNRRRYNCNDNNKSTSS